MKHIGLFEGIGGFSLAARWMGWETVAWCEWDEFCQKVLKHHFPEAEQHGDITTTDFTRYAGQIDVLTGGFPCQPYSSAGKRLGKEDDRHLWPEMLRAIREIQPRWVVGENVRGLTNWNGGLVFDEVQADLENEGYQVTPYLLPACAVNAPHRRDRIWFVAYKSEAGLERPAGTIIQRFCNGLAGVYSTPHPRQAEHTRRNEPTQGQQYDGGLDPRSEFAPFGGAFDAANANERQCQTRLHDWKRTDKEETGTRLDNRFAGSRNDGPGTWECFPTQSPICSRNDGISDRLAGITFSKHREKSIGAYGNAIVPQVAYQIFKAIKEYENLQL